MGKPPSNTSIQQEYESNLVKYILEGYGRLQAKVWAAEALIDRTAERLSEAIHAPRHELTQAKRGEIAVRKLPRYPLQKA